MNATLDIVYLLIMLIGSVILWRALWNMMDNYIPNTLAINIVTLIIGLVIIAGLQFLAVKNRESRKDHQK